MRRGGIVAGKGALPRALACKLVDTGIEPVVARLDSIVSELWGRDLGVFSPGQISTMAWAFRRAGVEEIFFAGSVGWPALSEIRFDWGGMVPALWSLTGRGDAILRAVARAFGRAGVRVGDPRAVLGELLATPGHLAGPCLSSIAKASISAGLDGALLLGRLGRGQSAIAFRGRLFDLEDRDGTDALVSRAPGPGAVLVKVAAPGQDLRFDLPTIGPTTVRLAAARKLAAIIVEAGTTIILERAQVDRLCRMWGVCLVGIEPENRWRTSTAPRPPGRAHLVSLRASSRDGDVEPT